MQSIIIATSPSSSAAFSYDGHIVFPATFQAVGEKELGEILWNFITPPLLFHSLQILMSVCFSDDKYAVS